jgi:hypothetical protein
VVGIYVERGRWRTLVDGYDVEVGKSVALPVACNLGKLYVQLPSKMFEVRSTAYVGAPRLLSALRIYVWVGIAKRRWCRCGSGGTDSCQNGFELPEDWGLDLQSGSAKVSHQVLKA